MRRLRSSLARLAGLLRGQSAEREFEAELASHLAMHVEDNLRAGMTPEQARRHAVLKLGNVESTRQAYRERRTVPLVEHLVQDARFAVRQLAKNPGFTCTAILMLSLGTGAAVAIFGFVDAALIAPLPYRSPATLASVTESVDMIPRAALSYPDYLDWKRVNNVFSALDVYGGNGYMLRTPAGTELVRAARVSDGFFRTLGITPVLGRTFHDGEDLPAAPHTVILSHATWQTRFGGRRDVIGQVVSLSGTTHTVIGVLPETFHFAPQGRAEFWTALHASGPCDIRRSCHALRGIGRLVDGVSIEAAAAEMKGIASQLERQYPDSNRGQGASVIPLSEEITGDVRPILLVLLGGAGLLFLIGCVNAASLLLVRSEARRRELAVRSALGASTARLISQFATEASLLAMTGGALGLLCAGWAMDLLRQLISPDRMAGMPFLEDVGVNPRVAAFAAAVSLLSAIVLSLTPAARLSSPAVCDGLADGSRGSAGTSWRRLGATLVIVELATSVVLLAGAGLLGRSFYRLLHVDLGFQPAQLATLQVALPSTPARNDQRTIALAREVIHRVKSVPGVEAAAVTSLLPVSFNGNTDWIRFVGRPYDGEHNEVNQRDVSADYFRTLRATLIRGRYFTDAEDTSKPLVVVINQALAAKYFPGQDPIGQRFGDTSLSPGSIKEIVGIVEDIREGPLDSEIWPAVYYPINQSPDTFFSVVARTSQDPASVLPVMIAALHRLNPDLGTADEATMAARVDESPSAYLHRSAAWLVGGFAALALLLGAVGLYGVVAYSVSQRTREIGVRMALGAQRSAVYRLVLREAGWLTVVGLVIGLGSSVMAAMLIRTLLFNTPPWDVEILGGVAVVLAGSSLLASYIPARRAAAVNPIEALRNE